MMRAKLIRMLIIMVVVLLVVQQQHPTILFTSTQAWMVQQPQPSSSSSLSSQLFFSHSFVYNNRHIPHSTTSLFATVELPSREDVDTATTTNTVVTSSVDHHTSSMMKNKNGNSIDEEIKVVGRLVLVLPQNGRTKLSQYGSHSPVDPPTLYDAATHLVQKCHWYTNQRLQYDVIVLSDDIMDENKSTNQNELVYQKLCQTEILIAFGITSPQEIQYLQKIFETRRRACSGTLSSSQQQQQQQQHYHRLCHFALDGGGGNVNHDDSSGSTTTTINTTIQSLLPPLVGPYDPQHPTMTSKYIPWSRAASGRRLYYQLQDLFSRYTSDDFCYGIVLFLHLFSGHDIDWVKHQTDASWEKGPIQNVKEFYHILTKCNDCIVPCMKDDQCRECLTKMSQLDPRDQATSYRTLVSYESDLLTKISRCIFTKNNIFQCNAQIPIYPKVQPLTTFRNQPLTEEMGRALLVGHLSNEGTALSGNLQLNVSWMVAGGANVAYDQFPNQHQLFYPVAKGRDMWYDPYFRVITLDGRHIWCQRHYKVRPGTSPGTFRLSTSDNGVTSDEQWTILGVADDLSWLLIHYAGAAKAVGLQYMGGLLCTPDGTLPHNSTELNRIWQCFQKAGIQPWELTMVDNRMDTPNVIQAGLPPLNYYRSAIQQSRQQQNTIPSPLYAAQPSATTTTNS
jgi:hypothetical protein